MPGCGVNQFFASMRNGIRCRRCARPGFTLAEVMIVIAIILALASLIGIAVFNRFGEAQENITKIQMKMVEDALKSFRFDFNRYPTDEEGVSVLWSSVNLENPEDEDKWSPYLESPSPNDQWNTPWGYRQISEYGDESTYDLWSFGPDGEEDTDDDITSWSDAEGGEDSFDFESAPSGG